MHRRIALLLGLAAFLVYAGSLRTIQSIDATTNVLVAYSLVRDRDIYLDENGATRDRLSYWSFRVGDHELSPYPPGAAIVGAPFAALGTALGVVPPDPLAVVVFGRLAASLCAAASVAFVYLAASLLTGARAAMLAAALYALGGATWPISGGALWQHGPAQLALSAALYAGLRGRAGPSGLGFGLAALARLTDLVFLVAAAIALAAYLTLAFGSPFDTRYASFNITGQRDSVAGVLGNLVSPGRGLLVFSPWVVFAFAGLWRAPAFVRLQAVAALTLVPIFASAADWWGGYGYGNRYLADALPVLTVGLAIWLSRPHGALARIALAAFAAWSIAVALVGALFYDWQAWSLEVAHPGPEIAWRTDPTPWLYAASRASLDPLTLIALVSLAVAAAIYARVSSSSTAPRSSP